MIGQISSSHDLSLSTEYVQALGTPEALEDCYLSVRAGRLSALSVYHIKPVLYGTFA